jgi:beta-glucosidase
MKAFPKGFLWGVSSSSYQVEGAATEGGRGASVWDAFCRRPGAIADGTTGDVACDSWHRPEADLALLRGLGIGAYRFSVSWPRVQPDGAGKPLAAGLDWYRRFAEGLLAAGIDPWVTLYHWDLPQALEDKGGWPSRDTAFRFADYAEIVYRALGDLVPHWVTFNEPWCSAFLGYGNGEHAPGRRDKAAAYAAAHHHLLAHGLAVRSLRDLLPGAEIGLVINPSKPRPATAAPADEAASLRASVERTALWLDPVFGRGYPSEHLSAHGIAMPVSEGDLDIIAAPIDFLGVNYYNEDAVSAAPAGPCNPDGFRPEPSWQPCTEMGWPIVPEGLPRLLRFISKSWSPPALYVTENGAAFPDFDRGTDGGRIHDRDRIAYLASHVAACKVAIEEGLPLKGYFAWTLLDNFEWSLGYSRKFGLVEVEAGSFARRPKDSYYWFRDLVAGHLS